MAPFRNNDRGGRGGPGGPKLPAALQEELYGPGGGKKAHGTYAGNRKEMRKQARHPARGIPAPPGPRGPPAGRPKETRLALTPVPVRKSTPAAPTRTKEVTTTSESEVKSNGKRKITSSTSTPLSRMLGETPAEESVNEDGEMERSEAPKKKKKKAPLELPSSMGGAGGGKEEDDEIEWLEWKLGLKGKKDKTKAKAVEDDLDDGLDDLLNFADQIGPGGSGYNAAASDDEGDEEDEFVGDEQLSSGMDDELSVEDDEEEWGGIQDDEMEAENDDFDDNDTVEEYNSPEGAKEAQHIGMNEDKVLLDPASNSIAPVTTWRYVPPHMRAATSETTPTLAKLTNAAITDPAKLEAQRKLERKAQGLLNKLSEANIEAILKEIEDLYRGNSRHDVTSTLTNLILTMISSKSNLLDSFVVLYATLVGTLYKVIGVEFGAHFLQSLVTQYHTLAATTSTAPVAADQDSITTATQSTPFLAPDAGKQPLNLLVLICELYNAQLVSSKLIYDLIREFLQGHGTMGEFEVEGLLKVLRCCGSQLRADDPGALKEIVALTQKRTSGHEKDMSSRARFMLETLANVKNNKIKATNGTEQGVEATARMKKFLNGLGKKRQLRAYEPLRVSLKDLLSADSRGKWWLVGAGWSGNPLVDREAEIADIKVGKKRKVAPAVLEDEELLQELARKQGMNTDVRRAVFVVLMTSEDYEHACDRLLHLNLTEVQQREFVRVAMHCAGLEPTYNPYYTLIIQRLCADSYSHRFTLQYALWDFLREMGEAGVGGSGSGAQFGGESDGRSVSVEKAVNIARAVAFGVARGSLDLTLYKPVDFTSLKSKTKAFFRAFFVALCLATQTASPSFILPKQARPFASDELEEIAQKTLSNLALAQGIFYFLETEMGNKALGAGGKLALKSERERSHVRQGVDLIKAVVGTAV